MSNTALANLNFDADKLLTELSRGQILRLSGLNCNALIICHQYYSEFVGPGSAVGGLIDLDCHRVIAIGKLGLTYMASTQERQKAYLIRKKWIRAIQKVVDQPVSLQRAKTILLLMEKYCGNETVKGLSDEIIASLVGVLPKTVTIARQSLKKREKQDLPDYIPEDTVLQLSSKNQHRSIELINFNSG